MDGRLRDAEKAHIPLEESYHGVVIFQLNILGSKHGKRNV